jgi:anti-anti-sigma regulatory factor/GAF domain-containing protein
MGAPPATSGEGSAEAEALRQENAKLREEIMRLLRVEADLFRRNELLDAQAQVYRALADIGNELHSGVGVEAIAKMAVRFALYTLNLERCVILVREHDHWRTLAADGYYDDVEARAIADLSFPHGNAIVEGSHPNEHDRVLALPKGNVARDATGQAFLVDAYAWIPFRDGDGMTILGCLIAGNTARKARHHGRIDKDDPTVLALKNLVELAAVAIRNARLDANLREERQNLEARVLERTAEIAEVNERLVISLDEHKRTEDARRTLETEIFRAQEERLRELSTPILPITDEILVIPLLGVMDEARAEEMCNVALEGVAARRARFLILDITGVRLPDVSFAAGLRKTAKGVELLGARVIVTGIRAEVARTLLMIDTELGALVTQSTLRGGFAYALARRRRG